VTFRPPLTASRSRRCAGEFTDVVMMRDRDRVASLFTPDGVWRMPDIPAELVGREEIRAWGERVPALKLGAPQCSVPSWPFGPVSWAVGPGCRVLREMC
jgi:SnoaL-like domain